MLKIVDTVEDRTSLLSKIELESFFMEIVASDADRHPANNSISVIFFYFILDRSEWALSVDHTQGIALEENIDLLKTSLKTSVAVKMVRDKKKILHFFQEDYNFTDISIVQYLECGLVLDEDISNTTSELFIRNNFPLAKNFNRCVPIYKFAAEFHKLASSLPLTIESARLPGFEFLNDTMSTCFYILEKNGLAIDRSVFLESYGKDQKDNINSGKIYTQYNLFTSTGRPSNRFGGVNFAAINKSDGSRCGFISRHGSDGMLVMMDFNAFHPRLIAHLINYPMGIDVNPYEYLGKYYFPEIETLNEEDIAVSKGLTFPMLYGGIDPRWKNVPYFKKVQEYIDHRWKFFENNGYIETPIFRRQIKPCHIENPSATKVFNYILQAYETEHATLILRDVISLLSDKKTCPILYTYDSVLFDAHKEDTITLIRKIKELMEGEKFPVKVYVGKTYNDMKKIEI